MRYAFVMLLLFASCEKENPTVYATRCKKVQLNPDIDECKFDQAVCYVYRGPGGISCK